MIVVVIVYAIVILIAIVVDKNLLSSSFMFVYHCFLFLCFPEDLWSWPWNLESRL